MISPFLPLVPIIYRVFPTGGTGGSPSTSHQIYSERNLCPSSLPQQIFIPSTEKQFSCYSLIKTSFLQAVIAPVQFFFKLHILLTHRLFYLQNIVFSFEKGLNSQSHSLSDSHHPIKEFPLVNFPIPLTLKTVWKNPDLYGWCY